MEEKENFVTDKNRNEIREVLFNQVKSLESVQQLCWMKCEKIKAIIRQL